MNLEIGDNIRGIAPYKPGKPIAELAREYGVTDAVKLASNENPLGPSPRAAAAVAAATAGLHRYPDGAAFELRRRLAAHLGVDAGCVVVGNGSDEIIGMLSAALLRPGDEVLLPHPSFLMYEIMTRCAGADPVSVPLDGLSIDLQAMAGRVGPRTRMVFVCNPNNPTGTAISRRRFETFLERLPPEVVVVVDEAYMEFVRDPDCARGLDYVGGGRPLAVLRTFSKAYGLAGLRIGYGVMAAELADLLHRVRQPFNVSIPAQAGAAAALDDADFLARTIRTVHEGLDSLQERLRDMGLTAHPTQANFFLIDVGRDADALFEQLLRHGVIVRSMSAYGYPRSIRINVGLPEENRRFLAALEAVLAAPHPEETGSAAGCPLKAPGLLITIDGPSGAGKTTVSRMLAERLGARYVDTGALYRAVALAMLENGVEPGDDPALERLCRGLDLSFRPGPGGGRIFMGPRDVSDRIRTPRVTMTASAVSARPVVRRCLLDVQRRLGSEKNVVFEGRDMGTVVFPEADVKFFLDADSETRSRRRFRETGRGGGQTLEEVRRDMQRRDRNDSTRELAPLQPADEAVRIDSSRLTLDEVVACMLDEIRRRGGGQGE